MRRIQLCLFSLFYIFLFNSCVNPSQETEKVQKNRENIKNVKNEIRDIQTNIYLSAIVVLDILDDYLVVTDILNPEYGIHLFNLSSLEYVTSAAKIGNGPGEITRIGQISIDGKNKTIWAPDLGKQVFWKFRLDSILLNPSYKPTNKLKMNKELLLVNSFGFLNDSIGMGKAVNPIGASDYIMTMAKFNLNNNKYETFGYIHPEAQGKRTESYCKVSIDNSIYVDVYNRCDLLTICDLEGNIKYNVYGDEWFNKDKSKSYYEKVSFYRDNIIASYNGDVFVIVDNNKRPKVNAPSKLLVFKNDGDYKFTIETVYKFSNFCVDEDNKRIFAYYEDRENPLGYFDLSVVGL